MASGVSEKLRRAVGRMNPLVPTDLEVINRIPLCSPGSPYGFVIMGRMKLLLLLPLSRVCLGIFVWPSDNSGAPRRKNLFEDLRFVPISGSDCP